ncbi:MAG: hypothetical protein LBJ13_01935 [Puniceicoccales bacterium]|jgi:hypothetical protein|nr:hypothetical protein [Puniceicoccales bacterium]
MGKKINIVWKIFLQYILWCGIFCVQFIEGAVSSVTLSELSDERGGELLGGAMVAFNENCNVLECEGIKYVNWFFPINTLAGYQHFFDVYCRKVNLASGNFLAEILSGEQGSIDAQRNFLKNYITGVQNYLTNMSRFYQEDSPWKRQKEVALGFLGAIAGRINVASTVEQLDAERSKLRGAGNVWPCMHTEPICVYDKWNGHNVVFLGNPVHMRSYLEPCSNWNCLEMLEEIARQTGKNINFGHYH